MATALVASASAEIATEPGGPSLAPPQADANSASASAGAANADEAKREPSGRRVVTGDNLLVAVPQVDAPRRTIGWGELPEDVDGLLGEPGVDEDEQRHGFDHRHGSGEHARVMTTLGRKLDGVAVAVDRFLR